MPKIPGVPSGMGGIRPDVELFGLPDADRDAVNQSQARLGATATQFFANLVELQNKASAQDFAFQNQARAVDGLSTLERELQTKYSDDVFAKKDGYNGYADEYRARASEFLNGLAENSPNGFADQLWGEASNALYLKRVDEAIGYQNSAFVNQSTRRHFDASRFEFNVQFGGSPTNYVADLDRAMEMHRVFTANVNEKILTQVYTPESAVRFEQINQLPIIGALEGMLDEERVEEVFVALRPGGQVDAILDPERKKQLLDKANAIAKRKGVEISGVREQTKEGILRKVLEGDTREFGILPEEINAYEEMVAKELKDRPERAFTEKLDVRFAVANATRISKMKHMSRNDLMKVDLWNEEAYQATRKQLMEEMPEVKIGSLPAATKAFRDRFEASVVKMRDQIIQAREKDWADWYYGNLAPNDLQRVASKAVAGGNIGADIARVVTTGRALGVRNVNYLPSSVERHFIDLYKDAKTNFKARGVVNFYNKFFGMTGQRFGAPVLARLGRDAKEDFKELLVFNYFNQVDAVDFERVSAAHTDEFEAMSKTLELSVDRKNQIRAEAGRVVDELVPTFLKGSPTKNEYDLVNVLKKTVAYEMLTSLKDRGSMNAREIRNDLFNSLGQFVNGVDGKPFLLPKTTSDGQPINPKTYTAWFDTINDPVSFQKYIKDKHGGFVIPEAFRERMKALAEVRDDTKGFLSKGIREELAQAWDTIVPFGKNLPQVSKWLRDREKFELTDQMIEDTFYATIYSKKMAKPEGNAPNQGIMFYYEANWYKRAPLEFGRGGPAHIKIDDINKEDHPEFIKKLEEGGKSFFEKAGEKFNKIFKKMESPPEWERSPQGQAEDLIDPEIKMEMNIQKSPIRRYIRKRKESIDPENLPDVEEWEQEQNQILGVPGTLASKE